MDYKKLIGVLTQHRTSRHVEYDGCTFVKSGNIWFYVDSEEHIPIFLVLIQRKFLFFKEPVLEPYYAYDSKNSDAELFIPTAQYYYYGEKLSEVQDEMSEMRARKAELLIQQTSYEDKMRVAIKRIGVISDEDPTGIMER